MIVLVLNTGSSSVKYQVINPEVNVLTVEDPVEYVIEGARQLKIGYKMNFEQAIRSILRHDPDIIMIGEIRDAETAEIAVRAALTGHLVFSTIHARHSVGCLHRLHDLGIPYEDMLQTLIGIAAQKIVPMYEDLDQLETKHRALYEILCDESLADAIRSAKQQQEYELPEHLSFGGQIREGVRIGALHAGFEC